jgi:hypothetical protein
MMKPADNEKIQLIAILRLLDCSFDSVASILHVSQTTIKDTESWLQKENLETVCNIIDTRALRATAGRELPFYEELDKAILMKAGHVTQEDILRHYNRNVIKKALTSLRLGSPSVNIFTDGISVARYATIEVVAINKLEAKNCWARVQTLPKGNLFPLHWAGTPYTSEETTAPRITIQLEIPARLDVAVALPTPGKAVGLLQDTTFSGEVAMFLPSLHEGSAWNGQGCWLAQPLALNNPNPRLQSYLKPSSYRIKVTVGCENGEGDNKEFILQSPASWEGLTLLT